MKMTEKEAKFILYKASAAYPNVEIRKETIAVWIERLENISFNQALENLNHHIDTNEFFPRISSVINRSAERGSDNALLTAQTDERFSDIDAWEKRAIDCPPHLLRLKSGVEE